VDPVVLPSWYKSVSERGALREVEEPEKAPEAPKRRVLLNPPLDALKQHDVAAWNQWRLKHPEIRPDLSGIDLSGIDLSGVDLSNAILSDAKFNGTILRGANFTGAILINADLDEADLTSARLAEANLSVMPTL
jgi:hypothetical protein